MRRESATNRTAGILRGRGKLYEYSAGSDNLIALPSDFSPSKLFPLAIGFLGDFAAERVSLFANSNGKILTSHDDVAFSAKTFLAYANARIDEELHEELVLLSSSAFHLIDMPGVSRVQAIRLLRSYHTASYLERVLIWALIQPWASAPPANGHLLEVDQIARALSWHYKSGISRTHIAENLLKLKHVSYASYDDRALLLADLFSAVVVSRYESSSRFLLHKFAKTSPDAWTKYLSADSAVHELWPSQRKIGEAGVLSGASAIVQMPTSAGKTKATELILRTAFTAGRARLAIVVAPFVALCDEIHEALRKALAIDLVSVNRLGDALQVDYENAFWDDSQEDDHSPNPHVIVITPEKLLYVLRQRPEVSSYIDLVIYDEGHQFDSGARGVTYELLLTSIKERLRKSAQTVLISAVIQNATVVADWLLGSKSKVVVDTSNQTQRSIGFTSQYGGGEIHFIPNSESEPEFAVPGVMVREELKAFPREKSTRHFPLFGDPKSVALYLGLRLVENGGVAIFCGKKDSAPTLLKYALDIFSREPSMLPPSVRCNEAELTRFVELYGSNFGANCYLTKSAELGFFSHTGGTPRGLRTAIEHGMRERLISFVVCTSTLAQGVNLPIKYLLVTGTYQGKELIRVRDFKNLMGRAGRAGMHEEGSVIFCDTKIFDNRNTVAGARNWRQTNQLISPESEDPVGSSLLFLVHPFTDQFGGKISELPPVDIAIYLLGAIGRVDEIVNTLKGSLSKYRLEESSFRYQLVSRLELLKRLQSYVMASAVDLGPDESLDSAALAGETLAYHLATDHQRVELVRLFVGVSDQISAAVPSTDKKIRFGRSLLGVISSIRIDAWVEEHFDFLMECADVSSVSKHLWPLFLDVVEWQRLHSCDPPQALETLFQSWLNGETYANLLDAMSACDATYPWGESRRRYDIDDVVSLCESFFGYEVPLVMAAVRSSVNAYGGDIPGTRRFSYRIDVLQKQIKYGLPNQNCVAIFEAGFSDRVVAQRIERQIWGRLSDIESVCAAIRDWQADVEDAIDVFPSYFRSVFLRIIAGSDVQSGT